MKFARSLLRLWSAGLAVAAVIAAQSSTVNVQVGNQTDTTLGVKGKLQVAMSTSFQLAGWDYTFFGGAPGAPAMLTGLDPFHTRVQVVADGIPQTDADTWDFTELDTMLSPIQATGDHSPELQIGTAPAFLSTASGNILAGSIPAFAQMSANLVKYYNTGGFTDAGRHYQSPMPYPVTWWGIFNEPDGNGVGADEYVTLYNTVVPAMAAADPSIKFVAVELAGGPAGYMPTFVTGVKAHVDVVAKHFYSSCNQKDYDQSVLSTVPGFAAQVQTMYQDMALNPALANVPIWITENNVNADYDKGDGMSACNGGLPFVLDQRGTSPFFAAWRSLVFQQLGEAGVEALYHWAFGTDHQYGEVDGSGNPYFSYYVDYYLSHWLPSPPGQDILQVTTTGCCAADYPHGWLGSGGLVFDTQTMAARNVDGSVVILMSNYALGASYDNNGPGQPRTFALDLSALGSFKSATLVMLDKDTPSGGPVPQSLAPSAQMQVTLPGYGAAFLRLTNASPNLPVAGVVNAASFKGGAVAPGEIVSLFGTALGPAQEAFPELTNPWLFPNAVEGVHVLFDGVPAPITFANSGQVNAVVPNAVAGQANTVLQVEYLGVLSPALTLPVVATAPGIFSANYGTGQGAILNTTGDSPGVNSASNPIARGQWVSIFGTGGGVTTPAMVDGMLASATSQVNADVTVTMDSIPCTLNYEGAAPYLINGAVQINAQVPENLTPGSTVPLVITIGGVAAQSGVTVAVK